ncbi:unnamed protein product [Tilletia controversa]|nr:unnamed protein product [Tilletia controversa]CAD6975814.1 unnamed protein product [Tilletia controversa]
MDTFGSDDSQYLRDIVRDCDLLIQRLPAHDWSPPASDKALPIATIDIRGYGSAEFSKALQQHRLSQSLSAQLLDIYMRAVETFAAQASQLASRTNFPVGHALTAGNIAAYMQRKCDSWQESMLAMVQEGKQRLELDVSESAAEDDDDDDDASDDDSSSSSDDAVDAGGARKHPPQALRILELAFERTSNITHAEKNRIARAIGLTPRQVTVWFQNRRNRRKPESARTPASQPESSKKRKLATLQTADIDDEMEEVARVPSSLPEKRQRCNRQTSAASSSSISSVASFESNLGEWTSHGAKYGRGPKPRNDSGDSSFTSVTSISSGSMDSSLADISQLSQESKGPPLRTEQPPMHDFLFHPDGSIQPDWDDLELDLGQLEQSLAESFQMGASLVTSPSLAEAPVQPLTMSALRQIEDRTPTSGASFAEQQCLAAAHPSIAAFKSISQAENWSFLQTGVLGMPTSQDPPTYSNDEWQSALLNLDCDVSDISSALSFVDEIRSNASQSGHGHQQDSASQLNAFLAQYGQDFGSSLSGHSSATESEDSKLHLDFDFDFSRLGFATSPVSTPSIASEDMRLNTIPEQADKQLC